MNRTQEQDNMEEEHLETKKQIKEKVVAETENSTERLANKTGNFTGSIITCQRDGNQERKDKHLLENTQKFNIYLTGAPERENRENGREELPKIQDKEISQVKGTWQIQRAH